MDMNASPGNEAFAVCFVPAVGASLRLSAPLHIGQPLDVHDAALDLAEVAAAELPAYGFPRGEVRVMRNASVVQALPTVRAANGHGGATASRTGEPRQCVVDSQRAVARMALKDLRQQVSRARPDQPAPPAWIACVDQAQRVITGPEDQPDRPEGSACLTVAELHARLIALLAWFDTGVADPSMAEVRELGAALAH